MTTKTEDAFKDGGSSPPPTVRHPLSRARASALGTLGQHRRWAACTDPAERYAATQPARDGKARKLLAAARAMPGGQHLNDAQLAERAEHLRLAGLAEMRLHRDDRIRARKVADQVAELVQRFSLIAFLTWNGREPQPFTDDAALASIRSDLATFTRLFLADLKALGQPLDLPADKLTGIIQAALQNIILPGAMARAKGVRHG